MSTPTRHTRQSACSYSILRSTGPRNAHTHKRRTELSPSSPNVGENISHDGTAVVPAWKKELNERLAATRSRRLHNQEEQVPLPGLEHMESKVESRASLLAAKVAQRYANAPSYSEVLAAEARARIERTSAASRSAAEDAHCLRLTREVSSVSSNSWNPALDTEAVLSSHSAKLEPFRRTPRKSRVCGGGAPGGESDRFSARTGSGPQSPSPACRRAAA